LSVHSGEKPTSISTLLKSPLNSNGLFLSCGSGLYPATMFRSILYLGPVSSIGNDSIPMYRIINNIIFSCFSP
ncbi:hypothetical protein, partial [Streptobacillus moniliformis]|uniref:hypothetical protein n=1 Tax=Streptobacillus moniliformis TaxID=34105 RepID=UPI001E64E017